MGIDAFALPMRESQGRILVVEDEPDVRKAVRLGLVKSGYDVVEAEDGQKAIEILNSDDNPLHVDLIICDIRMPRLNGIEAIHYFRDQYPTKPVIVLTAFPDLQLATSLLKHGVSDYLVKPVEREKLQVSIAAAIEKAPKGRF